MELGAGWGPWPVVGAVAGSLRGIEAVRLLGVEADPGRVELMVQHLRTTGSTRNSIGCAPLCAQKQVKCAGPACGTQRIQAARVLLENEKPTRFVLDRESETLETMTTIDGAQVWRNPTLV